MKAITHVEIRVALEGGWPWIETGSKINKQRLINKQRDSKEAAPFLNKLLLRKGLLVIALKCFRVEFIKSSLLREEIFLGKGSLYRIHYIQHTISVRFSPVSRLYDKDNFTIQHLTKVYLLRLYQYKTTFLSFWVGTTFLLDIFFLLKLPSKPHAL